MANPENNPVGQLQEFAVKSKVSCPPNYIECGVSGPSHARKFFCRCEYSGLEVVASGQTKKQAKSESAKKMIDLLHKDGYFDKFDKQSQIPAVGLVTINKNPISILQEFCQRSNSRMPSYSESINAGGDFLVECQLEDKKSYGTGTTKKSAKTEAAFKMCNLLNVLEQSSEQKYDSVQDDQGKEEVLSTEAAFKICNPLNVLEQSSKQKYNSMQDVQGKEEVLSVSNYTGQNKHPVSDLQEFCVRNGFPAPIYQTEEADLSKANPFIVHCRVNKISGVGTHLTKKGAKYRAADLVLKQLQLMKPEHRAESCLSMPIKEEQDECRKPTLFKLEEFLSSDEDNEEDKNTSNNLSLEACLQSISLDDSGVEIDPGFHNCGESKLKPHEFKVKSEVPVISKNSN